MFSEYKAQKKKLITEAIAVRPETSKRMFAGFEKIAFEKKSPLSPHRCEKISTARNISAAETMPEGMYVAGLSKSAKRSNLFPININENKMKMPTVTIIPEE